MSLLAFVACAGGLPVGEPDGSAGISDASVDATPGQPDAIPGQPDAIAGQPDATPGQPDATPGQPDATVQAPDAASGPTPDAPVVSGETSAGHARPSWLWTTPATTAGFRYRVDGGAWQERAVGTAYVTSPVDLAEGAHLFEVQARNADYGWSPAGSFTTTVEYYAQTGFWNGVQRTLPATPYGHICAISAHNCYQGGLGSPSANLSETLSRISAAQAAGADLIELDIKEQGGVIRIEHEDTGSANGALLVDVLDSELLANGDQIVFIEIKETAPTAAFIAELVGYLRDRRQYYAHNGRPVVLRAFDSLGDNLSLISAELNRPENLLIREYVRTSVLYSGNQTLNIGEYQGFISAAANAGHHMVEFHYQDANLASKLAWARSLGLGINLWTIPVHTGEVFVGSLRDEADVLTTEYSVASARSAVQAANALFYVDATGQGGGGGAATIPYWRTNTTTYQLDVNGSGEPSLSTAGAGGTLYGGFMSFAGSHSGVLYDADVPAGHGVLISVVAKFGSVSLGDGETRSLLAKTEGGAWGLELHNPPGGTGTVLRFAVRVGGGYVYASTDAGRLNTSNSYLITAAYDGDGGVRLWVDNSDTNVATGSASGGIVNNDVPVRIGADPIGATGAGYFFVGSIQRVLGQSWAGY